MTEKKDTNDFDNLDDLFFGDFDFGNEVTAKNEPPVAVVPNENDFDFDFDDEPSKPVGENVIKKQNTINDKKAETASVPSDEYDFDLDDKDDFDFGSPKPKPTLIRKIDCTSLNETEKDFVCLALAIRDQTKRKNLLSDLLIRMRFVQGGMEDRIDFITEIMKGVVESNRLEKNGKKYFFKALKKSMIDLIVVGLDDEFKEIEDLIVDEIDKNS